MQWGEGEKGHCDFSLGLKIGFKEEEAKFRLNVSTFLQLFEGEPALGKENEALYHSRLGRKNFKGYQEICYT